MSFTNNRFDALLGDDDTEVDKLGNVKPKEKKESDKAPTRRETRRNGQRQPAVSPPSRRDRGNRKEEDSFSSEPKVEQQTSRPPRERFGGNGGNGRGRGRQFDRHSGTGIHDNEKKIRQGWGEPGEAEYQGAHDSLNPNDPDAAEEPRRFGAQEAEDTTKTLGEYLADRKSKPVQLPEARKANEGSDDKQWKGAVVLEKEEDLYFVGGKSHEQKSKNKTKKEKVFLDIDQPPHRSQNDRRGGRGGGRGGRNNSRRNDHQGSVNLSDSSAFPNLGA